MPFVRSQQAKQQQDAIERFLRAVAFAEQLDHLQTLAKDLPGGRADGELVRDCFRRTALHIAVSRDKLW